MNECHVHDCHEPATHRVRWSYPADEHFGIPAMSVEVNYCQSHADTMVSSTSGEEPSFSGTATLLGRVTQ